MPAAYRPDIDGMRAFAVIFVLVFHAFPDRLPGGFVGVDVFFVISGFLITQIILSDIDRGNFSPAVFYARRVRRIFPALIVVLIASLALGYQLMLVPELTSLCKNAVASALFSANLMLLSETGYFDIDAHLKPLLHLWSLGIEEQFYLVWPWLLLVVPPAWFIRFVLAVLVSSFALNILLIHGHPSATFYLPVTRAWELMAGALVARWQPAGTRPGPTAAAGAIAIGVSLFWFNGRTVFPGWAAALPVGGTMLLICSKDSLFNRMVLGNRTAVNIGLISYPLYLWHWPLLVFLQIWRSGVPLTNLQRVLVLALSFALAWLTYKFVEKPIRFGKRRVVAGLVTSMAALAAAVTFPALGYMPPPPEPIRQLVALPANGAGWRVHECLLVDADTQDFSKDCAETRRPLVLVWGDSTAGALVPGFRALQKNHDFGLAQYTVSSCKPYLMKIESTNDQCIERNRKISAVIRDLAPDVVVLHAIWDVNDTVNNMRSAIDAIRSTRARIVILGPVPVWRGGLPAAVAAYYRLKRRIIPERTFEAVDPANGDDNLRRIAGELGVTYISARNILCNDDGCLARLGNSLTTSDTLHLTAAGSAYLVEAVAPTLLDGS
ncbi:MAG TPA: acyltransferase family protein [Bradyrhizobium sp.]|nr:acyltransferase family protein [Bradyrhizobium sp.]